MARLILYKLRSPYEMDYAKDGNLTKTEMDVNLLNLKGDIISSVALDEETNTLIVTKMKDGHKDCAGDIIDSGFKVDLNKLGFVRNLKVEDGKLIGEKSDGTVSVVDLSDLTNTQSDWEENDTTSGAYVKNRTHWKEVSRIFNTVQFLDTKRQMTVENFANRLLCDGCSAAMVHIGRGVEFWEYTAEDKEAISLYDSGDSITFKVCMKYPNTTDGVIMLNYENTDVFDDRISNILFDETRTRYNINENLDRLYPGERTYDFQDKGFENITYHKIDKNYLPEDTDNNVFTDTDELPVFGISKNTIYRLSQDDKFILYHNPTETDGEYLEIGGVHISKSWVSDTLKT